MRETVARFLFAVALAMFHLSLRIAGAKVYLVHLPALRSSASDRYRRLIERGEWN